MVASVRIMLFVTQILRNTGNILQFLLMKSVFWKGKGTLSLGGFPYPCSVALQHSDQLLVPLSLLDNWILFYLYLLDTIRNQCNMSKPSNLSQNLILLAGLIIQSVGSESKPCAAHSRGLCLTVMPPCAAIIGVCCEVLLHNKLWPRLLGTTRIARMWYHILPASVTHHYHL
jgi:hypothetical protein